VALAEITSDYDDLMGIRVYLTKDVAETGISSFDRRSTAVSNIQEVSWDIAYAQDMTLAEIYQFNLTVNETVDDNNDDIYVVVSGITTDNDNRNNHSIAGSTDNVDTSTQEFVVNNTGTYRNMTDIVDYAIEVKRADEGNEWSTDYTGLADGTYYFHVKAKDNAGNWGDTEHFQINIAAGGVSVAIVSPEDGQVFPTDSDEINISVKVMVSGNSTVQITAVHPDDSSHTFPQETFSTTKIFHNITLELGTNEIYAIANTSAGATTQSSSTYVIVARGLQPVTNKTLTVDYGTCSPTAGAHICYASEATNTIYVGMANEEDGSAAGTSVQADTETNTIKIFMSEPFNTGDVDDHFNDNEFLDLTTPSFSYGKRTDTFVVQNELRYDDIFVGGDDFTLPPGKYTLYINHWGVTEDGRVNLSITVE
jgi:hypothetical protein